MTETHVVFGAAGGLGSAIVRRLVAEGEPVRAVVRDVEEAREVLPPSAVIVEGDATLPDSVNRACRNATVIHHCVNVRYSQWAKLMPGITENILAGARAVEARLVFPGNVYVYGPLQRIPAREDHPLAATTRKGLLRIAMERSLMDAHRWGHVRVVIPRFPDFYGPFVANPLVRPIFESALLGKQAAWPGKLDVPHDLVYIDDAAAACVMLAASENCYGESWHVPGAGPLTGRQFLGMVFRAAGTRPNVKALSRILFRIFGLLIPDAREMIEMLYLFEQPLVLDGSKFAHAFPSFQYTPHEEGVRRTVEWYREWATE